MLSLTHDDMPNLTYASPEEVRGAQEKALNLWVGATSPLWAPFWLASGIGVGLWSMTQSFRRAQEAMGALPGSFSAWADATRATDVAATVQTMVDDGVIAPMQAAGKAIQDMTTAVTPSSQAILNQMQSTADDAKAVADDLGHAATGAVDQATARATEEAEALTEIQADAAADIADDTGSLLSHDAPAAAAAADTAVSGADAIPPAPRKPYKKG